MTCSGMFRGNLPPSTWKNLLPSKPGTSLLHFPIFILLPLVTNLLPLDANSPTSHNSSLTPLHKFQAPTLLLHTLFLDTYYGRYYYPINYSIWLVYSILPPYLTYFLPSPSGYLLTFPSGHHGLPCFHPVLKLSLNPQGLLCGHHYITSTN